MGSLLKTFALVNADDANSAVMVQNTRARKRSYAVRSLLIIMRASSRTSSADCT